MSERLVVILSRVPEHLSLYSTVLHAQTSQFLFFSDESSLLRQDTPCQPDLIIVDNARKDFDATQTVETLRSSEDYGACIILVITKDKDIDTGVAVLTAGANDYLSVARVEKELAVRVGIHWDSRGGTQPQGNSLRADFGDIYPEEDRLILERTTQHIDQHMSSCLSVGSLAAQVGRSEKELNNLFGFHLGMTAFAYMRACRMHKAKSLLAKTGMPIAQLALEVGYSNPANFSTAFKSFTGLSPIRYRAEALQIGLKRINKSAD